MIQSDWHGLPAMQQRVTQILAQTAPAAGESLYRAGNAIMGVSVTLVPIDTGNLRSTAHVERPQQQGMTLVVQLSYGGHGTAPYAVPVEFRQDVHHPIGQAFYLSTPIFAAVATLAPQLGQDIRAAWG